MLWLVPLSFFQGGCCMFLSISPPGHSDLSRSYDRGPRTCVLCFFSQSGPRLRLESDWSARFRWAAWFFLVSLQGGGEEYLTENEIFFKTNLLFKLMVLWAVRVWLFNACDISPLKMYEKGCCVKYYIIMLIITIKFYLPPTDHPTPKNQDWRELLLQILLGQS